MSDLPGARVKRADWIQRLTITSLALTLVALLLGLQFVYRTTGGTLFLFSAVAPIFVVSAIAIFLWTVIIEFRQAHKLFTIEHFPEATTIFRQGDPGDFAYFIRKGEVAVIDKETELPRQDAGGRGVLRRDRVGDQPTPNCDGPYGVAS